VLGRSVVSNKKTNLEIARASSHGRRGMLTRIAEVLVRPTDEVVQDLGDYILSDLRGETTARR